MTDEDDDEPRPDPERLASEIELMDAWRAGDTGAGEQLFKRYFPAVLRFFRSKLVEGADDLVQETFVAWVEGKDRMRTQSVRSYLFGIATYVLRGRLRRRFRDTVDLERVALVDLDPTASQIVMRDEQERVLLEALRRVPIEDQIVWELRAWEGLTAAEIAHALGLPEGTVKSRLRRSRQRVVDKIAEIEAAPEVLGSTVTDLAKWAARVREALGHGDVAAAG